MMRSEPEDKEVFEESEWLEGGWWWSPAMSRKT
jgi:hypothetical protein